MPKGNVKFANPEKVMTVANFRRCGGRRRNEMGNTKNLVKHTYLNSGKTKKNFLNKTSIRFFNKYTNYCTTIYTQRQCKIC